jgi:hypothetical protein
VKRIKLFPYSLLATLDTGIKESIPEGSFPHLRDISDINSTQ